MNRLSACLALATVAALPACGEDDHDHDHNHGPTEITVGFGALVHGAPFACGTAYPGFGVDGAGSGERDGSGHEHGDGHEHGTGMPAPNGPQTVEFTDFRFYVSNFEVRSEDGTWAAAELVADAPWQTTRVALVDLEDATGACANGTPETRRTVRLSSPTPHVTAVRFDLGVPFALNHQDAAVAEAPLNLTSLFWVWRSGYKFLRSDVRVTTGDAEPAVFNVHLGSTGCDGELTGGTTSCTNPNRARIELSAFDPGSQRVVLEWSALVGDSDLTHNTPETPPGCMSAPNDAECGPVFTALGLAGTEPQRAFFAAPKVDE